jgi:hypothetical protein
MTYEARSNGTHALCCNTGPCKNELISHAQSDLFTDANLIGWLEDDEKHFCPDCQRGISPGRLMLLAEFGSMNPTITAQFDVHAGDPVFDPDGVPYAIYKSDASAGQPVMIEAYAPKAEVIPVSAQYAEILGRTTPEEVDADPFAGFDPLAPPVSPKKQPAMKVNQSPRPSVQAPLSGLQGPSKASSKKTPAFKIEAFDESHNLFDFLDDKTTKTGWSPDDK